MKKILLSITASLLVLALFVGFAARSTAAKASDERALIKLVSADTVAHEATAADRTDRRTAEIQPYANTQNRFDANARTDLNRSDYNRSDLNRGDIRTLESRIDYNADMRNPAGRIVNPNPNQGRPDSGIQTRPAPIPQVIPQQPSGSQNTMRDISRHSGVNNSVNNGVNNSVNNSVNNGVSRNALNNGTVNNSINNGVSSINNSATNNATARTLEQKPTIAARTSALETKYADMFTLRNEIQMQKTELNKKVMRYQAMKACYYQELIKEIEDWAGVTHGMFSRTRNNSEANNAINNSATRNMTTQNQNSGVVNNSATRNMTTQNQNSGVVNNSTTRNMTTQNQNSGVVNNSATRNMTTQNQNSGVVNAPVVM